jgi:hypothetical protein
MGLTVSKTVRTHKLLTKARKVYADHGGARLHLVDKQGRVCAVGAIYEAAFNDPREGYLTIETVYAVRALCAVVAEQYPEYVNNGSDANCLVVANDDPKVTSEEILAIYDKTIARTQG